MNSFRGVGGERDSAASQPITGRAGGREVVGGEEISAGVFRPLP